LRDTGCLPSFAVHSERPVVGTINTRENILEMVCPLVEWPLASRMQVLRTLHEEVLYPYHDQTVQHLEPPSTLNRETAATPNTS
jgi:hypothetical protein